MEKFTVDGVVIRTSVTGESDRIVWVLTRDRGIIRAFAKGARGTKSRIHGGTSLFAYCSFSFSEKNDVYNINEALIKEVFFDLRRSLETLTLAQYFCEVTEKCVPSECSEEEYMRLLLNSFFLLAKGEKSEALIKSVFELRFCCISGYMPSLLMCGECSEYSTDIMHFNTENGELLCSSCGKHTSSPAFSISVISAMRHICFSDFSKIFSFQLNENQLMKLSFITEQYLKNIMGQEFRLLRYYKDIK